MNTGTTGTMPIPTLPSDPNIHRCSECFKELFEADRGYGSTALACPEHGFDRMILTVPSWLEGEIARHTALALRYVAFVVDNIEG